MEPDFAAGFIVPLVLGAEAGFAEDLVLWGIGLVSLGLSWVFEAEAAVGRIMRSRKLSEGAAVVLDFLGAAGCALRDSGRVVVEARAAGLEDEICCLGTVRLVAAGRVVDALLLSASCLAREAAVGAVRCEGRLAGLVVSRLAAGAAVFTVLDARLSRPEDAAVGAVRELRLVLRSRLGLEALVGDRGDLLEVDDFLSEIGDLRLLLAAFAGDPVATGSGLWLLRGLMPGLFEGVDLISATDLGVAVGCAACFLGGVISAFLLLGLRSSATGGNAWPPLTASSLTAIAGFNEPASSSAPVVGLSGLAGGSFSSIPSFSTAGVPASVCLSSSSGSSSGVGSSMAVSLAATWSMTPIACSSLGSTAGVLVVLSMAPSSASSAAKMSGFDWRLTCSSATSFFNADTASLSRLFVLKLSVLFSKALARLVEATT
jgi:hypothetical protein